VFVGVSRSFHESQVDIPPGSLGFDHTSFSAAAPSLAGLTFGAVQQSGELVIRHRLVETVQNLLDLLDLVVGIRAFVGQSLRLGNRANTLDTGNTDLAATMRSERQQKRSETIRGNREQSRPDQVENPIRDVDAPEAKPQPPQEWQPEPRSPLPPSPRRPCA
jgi:hypothetical protein